MKKIALLTFALLLMSGISNAQVKFGIKAGVNLTELSTESDFVEYVKGATNYQFGVLFQVKALGFAIQPEVLYSVKGGTFNNTGDLSLLADTRYKSQNIEIPVNLQYGLDAGIARIYVQAGPYVSFLTGGTVNESADDFAAVDENVSTMDFGLGLGVGAELLGVQLAVKYDWGLSKLGKEELLLGHNVNVFNELQNRNFSISLAYLF